MGSAQTQQAALSVVAPGGAVILTAQSSLGDAVGEGKKVKTTFGSPFVPPNRDVGLALYSRVAEYLQSGAIKVCPCS